MVTMTNQSKREQYFDEIFNNNLYSRCGSSNKDVEPKVSCDCIEHDEGDNDTIRSGNYVTCILKRKEAPEDYETDDAIWVIKYVSCFDCPVASLFERVDKESPIAVVEGELIRGEDCLVLSPRYIWDLHLPKDKIDM